MQTAEYIGFWDPDKRTELVSITASKTHVAPSGCFCYFEKAKVAIDLASNAEDIVKLKHVFREFTTHVTNMH